MYNVVKRTFDIIVSSILLLVLLPMLIFTAAVIKLSSPGPVFYCAPRAGLRGKPFLIIKFRTMKLGADKGSGTTALKDPRITKYGTFFRNYKIDELPQLINVLIGDMSLIGPRPERPQLEEKLNEKIPNYKYRHIVKPGLSGWAQVNLPYGSSISDSSEKLSYDLFYIQNKSIWLDLLIFIQTIKLIFNMKGY